MAGSKRIADIAVSVIDELEVTFEEGDTKWRNLYSRPAILHAASSVELKTNVCNLISTPPAVIVEKVVNQHAKLEVRIVSMVRDIRREGTR